MAVNTGSPTLDQALNGGLPEGRTTLFMGTPGTGKSTLAMQFLQQGIEEGDRCVYLTTEQTLAEIEDSFAPFDFTLDSKKLKIVSLHVRPGRGHENISEYGFNRTHSAGGSDSKDAEGFVLRTMEGDRKIDEHNVRFTPENLIQYLRSGFSNDIDRVVVDSISGLRPVSPSQTAYRRVALDLIQLFNQEVGATTVFTSESTGLMNPSGGVEELGSEDTMQFNVHGVVRLWREQVRGSFRRYLDIMKMRGVDHATRRFEISFDTGGVRIVPQNRTRQKTFFDFEHLPTEIDGLDEMLGGGFVRGRSSLLQHDGQADIESFLYSIISNALDQRMSIAIVPRVDTPRKYLVSLFDELGASMDSLLENNQLFVLDALNAWGEHENIYDVNEETIEDILPKIKEKSRGQGMLFSVNTEALVHTLGEEMSRELRYWIESQFIAEQDILIDVHNPSVIDPELSAFYLDAAGQVLDTWLTVQGLQYVQMRKGRSGDVGSVRVLEYIDEPPFVRTVK